MRKDGLDDSSRAGYERLLAVLKGYGKLLIAFSGGVDSTLLLRAAWDTLGDGVVAVTARSESYPEDEYRKAVEFARTLGVRHIPMDSGEVDLESFRKNPPDRCYFCKTDLFESLKEIARREGIRHVADGANADDEKDYRPGSRAAKELGVVSPLQEAGLTKAEIREVSRALGLPTWDKPSQACLASRFPYGEEISREKLNRVGEAEAFLKGLGFRQVRVRHHGAVARIEVDEKEIERFLSQDIRGKAAEKLRELGFLYVALDLEGYRTGSLNRDLMQKKTDGEGSGTQGVLGRNLHE